ncbi:BrnT family toxin [Alcaligenes endophyticus]|uniref:BrnT family toxin n=1 Tax=Alcaligenes endophyticus TaxID=1929088 RepID=A0ABT8EL34_9BURK|nr:BrnT family toxin [Alcaligenes endophyticus]MCX5590634.1 BrnT family toxin [Alcaligenes endophyticus]MDN4122002.1 BrnT family toxin [Alcaligenes endophyticus]
MRIVVDPIKDLITRRTRGFSLFLARDFNFDTALIKEDLRVDYGETRYQALGFIHHRLYFMCFTFRDNALRVISLRKANQRETQRYEREIQCRTAQDGS